MPHFEAKICAYTTEGEVPESKLPEVIKDDKKKKVVKPKTKSNGKRNSK